MPRWSYLLSSTVLIAFLLMVPQAGAVFLPRVTVDHATDERVPGVLVVQFEPGLVLSSQKTQGNRTLTGIASVDALSSTYGLRQMRVLFPGADPAKSAPSAPDLRGYHVLRFDPSTDLDRAASDYLLDPNIISVDYDFYGYIMRTPNDDLFGSMHGLQNAGDHDMDVPEAWDRTAGSPDVVLADTDTGVLFTHEDLRDNIWVNPGEDLDGDGVVFDLDDMNGIDDDNNGYIDDVIGWDFVSAGINVWPGEDGIDEDNDPSDFNGHGTHTSGTIAATTNNLVGVAGVAGGFDPVTEPGCKIMCLRMGYSFDDGGSENGRTVMSYVASAFRYAADNGAVAINYSFGSSQSAFLEIATDYAVAAGLVISASAGNSSNTSFGYLQSRPDVMNVASTTSSDVKSGFSNFGVEVDVSAPGSGIWSTVSFHGTPDYASYSGTSMAAPHVVGLVGLIKSLNPLLTGPEIIERIIRTTDNIDAENPGLIGLLGSGRINAAAALVDIASTDFTATPLVGIAPLTVNFSDLSATPPTAWIWDLGDGDSAFVQNPTHVYGPGLHDVSLRIATAIGDGFMAEQGYIVSAAESLAVASAEAERGQTLVIEIDAVNYLPLAEILLPILVASNSSPTGAVVLDSLVTTGCRSEYFEHQSTVFDSRLFGKIAVELRADNGGGAQPLEPGSGPIAKVWFTVSPDASPANPVNVSTDPLFGGAYTLTFTTPTQVDIAPVAGAGIITFAPFLGDLNSDNVFSVLDVVMIIEIVFRNAPPPDPSSVADVNCDGQLTVLDVVTLISTVFRDGPAPTCP